jgi:hypothetical protein
MTWNASIPALTNQIASDVPDIEENFACIAYINVWVPVTSMYPLTTNGAEAGEHEYATNDVMHRYFAFDGTTEEYVAFNIVMPENWNRSTLKAKFYWSPGDSACSATDTVEWQLQGISVSDDGSIDDAFTDTGEVISDAVTAGKNADLHITSATPAITINGSPALGDLVSFKLSRNVGGDDDMTEDAWLFGCYLQLGINEAVSAW